jgi:hypothetical protein
VTKQRDGEIGGTYAFELKVVELGYDENGDALTSCVVERIEAGSAKPAQGKGKKINPSHMRAFEFLQDTVADHGQPLERTDYPNVLAVTVDQWRERLKQCGLYDGEGPSRNWFDRCKKALIGARLITVDGRLVWPVPRR